MPLLVRQNGSAETFEIVAGSRRFLAAQIVANENGFAEPLPWHAARRKCGTMRGRLAQVQSQDENDLRENELRRQEQQAEERKQLAQKLDQVRLDQSQQARKNASSVSALKTAIGLASSIFILSCGSSPNGLPAYGGRCRRFAA